MSSLSRLSLLSSAPDTDWHQHRMILARLVTAFGLLLMFAGFSPYINNQQRAVDVREFGAKCDGILDDSAAFAMVDAATNLGEIGIYAICRISANITLKHSLYIGPQGALSIDRGKTLTIAGVASDAATPFQGSGTVSNGITTTQLINIRSLSLNGLGTVGQATRGDTNWLETYIPSSSSLSQFVSIATAVNPSIGGVGVTGAARSSDWGAGSVINAYGLAGFAVNDHATKADAAWAGLFLAVRKTSAVGATLGLEVEATNAVNGIVDVAPFAMFPSTGLTAGVWIAPSPCSFPTSRGVCASPTYNTSVAIGVVGNGPVLIPGSTHNNTTLDRLDSTTSILVNGPINGECIPAGTTVMSKTPNSVVMSNAATCTTTKTFNFSSVFRKGIVFDGWSLDQSVGTGGMGVAIEMGMKQSVRWVDDHNNPSAELYTDSSGVFQVTGGKFAIKSMITSCAGQPTGTLINNSGVVNVCP